jgi:hypothetical protein
MPKVVQLHPTGRTQTEPAAGVATGPQQLNQPLIPSLLFAMLVIERQPINH